MALPGRLRALLVTAFVLLACLPASAITFQNVLAGGRHVVYDRGSDRLYVSVGSTAPAYGDSIVKINPNTGIIEASVWVGLGPNALALSDDGQYLYVALDGSRTVRRVHLPTFTAGLEFGLGSHPTLGDYQAKAIAVMPGAPGTIAVARMLPVFFYGETNGIAIFDDGVQRPDVVDGDQGGESITFGPDGSYVYGVSEGWDRAHALWRVAITARGATLSSRLDYYLKQHYKISLAGGRLFGGSGEILEPVTLNYLGLLPPVSGSPWDVAVDPEAGLAFGLSSDDGRTIQAYSLATLRPLWALRAPSSQRYGRIVRWPHGVVLYGTETDRLVTLVNFETSSTLIVETQGTGRGAVTDSSGTIDCNTNECAGLFDLGTAITLTASPVSGSRLARWAGDADCEDGVVTMDGPRHCVAVFEEVVPGRAFSIALRTNDIIYSRATQRLYASVPGVDPVRGNSIVTLDPLTGAIGPALWVGSEPGRLALSDDGLTLYVAMTGSNRVTRVDATAFRVAGSFLRDPYCTLGRCPVSDIDVVPGDPLSVVVSIQFRDTSVYGNGVRRPLSVETDGESASIVEFGASGSRLYGTGKANTLLRMSVGADGVTVVDQYALTGWGHSQFVQGRLYTPGGYVIDPEVPSAIGRLGSAGNYPGTIAEDVANGFVYGALDRTTAVVVSEYDAVTLLPTQSVELPSERWADGRLCVVGPARLAFRSKPAVWFVDRVTFFDFNGPARRTVRIESAAPSAGARVAVVPPGTGGASVIDTPAALTFADGTSLTLTAQAGASAFRGWRIDGSLFAVNPLQFVVTGDRTVTAVYHAPAPTVTAIVPAAGSVLGGSSVTLRGSGFRPGLRVYFGGTLAPDVTIVDDSELRVTTPAGTGTVLFSVVNDDDLSAVQCCFAYVSTVVLDSLSPSRGLEAGGTVVAITGHGFVNGATTVSFGGVPASSVTVVGFNHLTAISPPGRGVVPVTVGTAVGYATRASGFTYVASGPPPRAFEKVNPLVSSTNNPGIVAFQWAWAQGAESYEYCFDTTLNNACDGTWQSVSALWLRQLEGPMVAGATYEWQVRAVSVQGTTEASGGWWRFTVMADTGCRAEPVVVQARTNAQSVQDMWQPTGIQVKAWVPMGLRVLPGQVWRNGDAVFTAIGDSYSGPVSGAGVPLPGTSRMALVGRVGAAGPVFYVGTGFGIALDTSGELYLAPNDDWNALQDNSGSISLTACDSGASCRVSISPTAPSSGAPGEPAAFGADVTRTGCEATPTYLWDFGDGSTSTSQSPTHAYASVGSYRWTLTVQAGATTETRTGTILVMVPGSCVPTTHSIVAKPTGSGVAGMWQATGVAVQAGQSLMLSSGTWQTWTNGGSAWTADGNLADVLVQGENAPMSGAPRMALVARIGPSGTPFLVGAQRQMTVPSTGALYLAPNDYWYMLWDNAGSLSVSSCVGAAPCSVEAATTVPATGATSVPVVFAATGTVGTSCTGTPTFAWDFGDGASSSDQNPSHSYALAGSYSWTLTVQAGTATATRTGTIVMREPGACVPSAHTIVAKPTGSGVAGMWQATGVTVQAGESVTLDAAGQTWTNGGRAWTAAGDAADVLAQDENSPMSGVARMALVGRIGASGTPFLVGTSRQVTASSTGALYLAPNDYWYLLWDNAGSLSVSACVGAAPCSVQATATVPTTGTPTVPVSFAATATAGTSCTGTPTFAWDFGDGGTSTAQNPAHTYAGAGTHTWTLTVHVGSATDTRTGSITVSEAGACVPTTRAVLAKPTGSGVAGMWQATGQTVRAGEALTLSVSAGQTWTNGGRAWTADGDAANVLTQGENSPLRNAPRMALAGRIGTSGTPFLIGSQRQLTAASAGELYLAPNDYWYLLWDNAGSLTVSVCAGAAPCSVEATATVPSTGAPATPLSVAAAATATSCASAPTYEWDFGDGSLLSAEQNPSHTYTAAGTYTWTLTVRAGTATATRTGTITIRDVGSCTPTAHVVLGKPTGSGLAGMWQATGVMVTAGEAVSLSVSAGQTWTNGGRVWTAAGDAADVLTQATNCPLANAPRMALVGRIGATGTPFLIGSQKDLIAAAGGELYLAPNDYWYWLWDNMGSLTVTVCR